MVPSHWHADKFLRSVFPGKSNHGLFFISINNLIKYIYIWINYTFKLIQTSCIKFYWNEISFILKYMLGDRFLNNKRIRVLKIFFPLENIEIELLSNN